jgi:hypothetical protein
MTNKRTNNGKARTTADPCGMTNKKSKTKKGESEAGRRYIQENAVLLAGSGGVVRVLDWQVGLHGEEV